MHKHILIRGKERFFLRNLSNRIKWIHLVTKANAEKLNPLGSCYDNSRDPVKEKPNNNPTLYNLTHTARIVQMGIQVENT